MKLYYMPGACSLATHIVLEWIGAPYETQQLSHDELKQDAYLRVNPAGAVPALAIDGQILTQNTAILTFLAERHPEAGLLGDNALTTRSKINRWLGFVNSDLHPAFKPLFGATAYLDDEATIAKTKAHAKQVVRMQLERAEAQCKDDGWTIGARSLVDPYLYVMLRWANMMHIDWSDLDTLQAFLQRMDSDPAVRRVLEAEGLA